MPRLKIVPLTKRLVSTTVLGLALLSLIPLLPHLLDYPRNQRQLLILILIPVPLADPLRRLPKPIHSLVHVLLAPPIRLGTDDDDGLPLFLPHDRLLTEETYPSRGDLS
jgi:hypothetical protein